MKATIYLTAEDIHTMIRAYVEERGCEYISHTTNSDGTVSVEAVVRGTPKALAAPPLAQPTAVQPSAPATPAASMPTMSATDLLSPSEDPDPDSNDTSTPPRRSHPKSLDEELVNILRHNNTLLEAQKK